MKYVYILLVAGCGSSPTAPLSGSRPVDPAGTPTTTGSCEPDATQGLESIRLSDGSSNPWRFVGRDNQVLATPFLFDNGADYFQEGFARIVDPSGKVGFISAAGVIVIRPTYDFAYPFCHGVTKTALAGKGGYLDTTGTPTTRPAGDDRPLIPPSHVD
jgi:hypothetical protein